MHFRRQPEISFKTEPEYQGITYLHVVNDGLSTNVAVTGRVIIPEYLLGSRLPTQQMPFTDRNFTESDKPLYSSTFLRMRFRI